MLLGVVYRDLDGDGFYSVGEGVAGVKVAPSRGGYHAITSAAGGYALPVPSITGAVDVSATVAGAPVAVSKPVTLAGANIKLDFELLRDAVVVAAPIELSQARYRSDGLFEFTVHAAPGDRVVVQAGDRAGDWTDLETRTLAGGVWVFIDLTTPQHSRRFYRARRV
jgi:hypothetical protein